MENPGKDNFDEFLKSVTPKLNNDGSGLSIGKADGQNESDAAIQLPSVGIHSPAVV